MPFALLFNHPGGEHVPAKGDTEYPWNTKRKHRRKFILADANIAEKNGAGFKRSQQLVSVALWGEWEPPSACGLFQPDDAPMLPKAWHRPLLYCGDAPPDAQNTDPWIFGDTMRYSNCRQWMSLLRSLEAGDVLFFGSVKRNDETGSPTKDWHFFLDTVFLVAEAHAYVITDSRVDLPHEAGADSIFRSHVAEPLARQKVGSARYTLYNGRMLDSESGGPFCYVPCRPAGDDTSPSRFARPMIDHLFGVTFPNPQTGYKRLDCLPLEAWQVVTDFCLGRCLELAVRVTCAGESGR